jgi:glycerate 2-kinase
VSAGIGAARPDVLVDQFFERSSSPVADRCPHGRVISVGKAAGGMARAFARHRGGWCREGVVVCPEAPRSLPDRYVWCEAAHPEPAAASVRAGRAAAALARRVTASEGLVVLLSGGASAMLALPRPPLTLGDKLAATRAMLRAGLAIHEINTVRKHLSSIKGGWLAAASAGPVLTLALSDVVGPSEDDPSVIGSGPAVPDPSTFTDALDVIERHGLGPALPASVLTLLAEGRAGRLPDTPKAAPREGWWQHVVIGGRGDAMLGAAKEAASRGYRVEVRREAVIGEARAVAPALVSGACEGPSASYPLCVISSGETIVAVRGRGRGGRNQELALAAVPALAQCGRPAVLASIGTDGRDGPTDAAGAIVDSETLSRAEAAGLGSLGAWLDDNDAYSALERLGTLVKTGPTGTNVGDLQVVLVS